ncbi:hypothetical protein K7X08_033257 [Anisodus acutangulus]|uniref:LisH domain-containing protein n=1 Tax=Anisodus acutangulus TaxID=402998 RepID=A0A9Q1M2B6_9SOLA|nr:hypothetical protein K7X08_033257 [Anisodus acutangulus]
MWDLVLETHSSSFLIVLTQTFFLFSFLWLRSTLSLVIATSSEARHSLDELVILNYMANKGFHQTGEVFAREIIVNHNPVAINAPEGFLLEWCNIFYEILSSRFPEVAQTVENIVPNINPENLTYALNHMGVNISNAMASSPVIPSPHLLSSFGTGYVLPDLSLPTDMTSGLQFPEMSEMGGMLLFASNSGYQMQQMPIVPPEWNARDDRPGINLGGPTRIEPNLCLTPWPEPSYAGNNKSLQQASHQGWPSVDILPDVAVQTLDAARASSGDFFCMFTQAGSSGNMLGDTNQRTPENLPADQQIIAPIVQSGRKRKAPMSPVASVRNTVAGFAVPARTRAERGGISFKEIRNLHARKSKLLCCHFNSQGELLATAGHDKKLHIWQLRNNNVNHGEGHTHHITDVRSRPNSCDVFLRQNYEDMGCGQVT